MTKAETFTLVSDNVRMGKLSSNTELHGDEYAAGFFQAPFERMLTKEQLNDLMGKHFDRSLFDYPASTNELPKPVDGFTRCAPLALTDHFDRVNLEIRVSGNRVMEFENCKAKQLVLEPQVGGLTKLKLQVYIPVGLGQENLILQEHQHREVAIDLHGKIALKKNPKQQSLELSGKDEADADADKLGEAVNSKPGTVIDGTTPKSRAAARRKAEAAAH